MKGMKKMDGTSQAIKGKVDRNSKWSQITGEKLIPGFLNNTHILAKS